MKWNGEMKMEMKEFGGMEWKGRKAVKRMARKWIDLVRPAEIWQ